MYIQIHNGMDNMSTTGRKVLGDLQDKFTPLVDLLVRESIQNSTDAAKPFSPYDQVVKISYDINSIQNGTVSVLFDGITAELNRKFIPSNNSPCLVVRDCGTVGLTGKLRKSDCSENEKLGNLIKLVYEIREAQDMSGSGGCWGLGKTVYFRLGIGMVLYYSRIYEDGQYKSRLAACMVEDEKSRHNILPSHPTNHRKSGIAWWGKADGPNATIPITEESEIKRILSVFKVALYTGAETGTTIIVPFLDEDKLLDITRYTTASDEDSPLNSVVSIDERVRNDRRWLKSLESFLRIAVMRWYYPRLDNIWYSNANKAKYIKVFVNGRELSYNTMTPIFQLQQALYNRSVLKGALSPIYRDFITDESFYSQVVRDEGILYGTSEVRIKSSVQGDVVGHVSYARANSSILKMGVPTHNRDPYKKFDVSNSTSPYIPVAYSRKPGMVVWYDDEVKSKTSSRIMLDDENFILAHFALNSNAHITFEPSSLEDYIRNTEKANHNSWENDHKNVVKRTKENVYKVLNRTFETESARGNSVENSGLSNLISSFLPPKGYGKKSSTRPTGPTSSDVTSVPSPKKMAVKHIGTEYHAHRLVLTYDVVAKKGKSGEFSFIVSVASESSSLSISEVMDKMQLTKTPFEFLSADIDDKSNNIKIRLDEEESYQDVEPFTARMVAKNGVVSEIVIDKRVVDEIRLIVKLTLSYSSQELSPVVDVK